MRSISLVTASFSRLIKLLIPNWMPNRGDVFVFHYPEDPSIDYIKRVSWLPGDEIRYENKELIYQR